MLTHLLTEHKLKVNLGTRPYAMNKIAQDDTRLLKSLLQAAAL